MIDFPNMLLIGSKCKNAGKTTLATKLIEKYKDSYKIIAIKVVPVHEQVYPEEMDFEIFEERNVDGDKDSSRLLRAGAEKSILVTSFREHLEEAIRKATQNLDKDVFIICESNSLKKFVKPSLFILMDNPSVAEKRDSAKDIEKFADIIINFEKNSFNFDIEKIKIKKNGWVIGD